jgi:hypothetical protein
VPGANSGSGPGDPLLRFASVYAGSRNSYRGSPCGLLPLLVNGKSAISTVFFVFLPVFLGFQRLSTTFAAVLLVINSGEALEQRPARPLRFRHQRSVQQRNQRRRSAKITRHHLRKLRL